MKQIYNQIAFVAQDNYLFDETIRENIRMGRPSASDKEVEAVVKAAGCDTFIRSLELNEQLQFSHYYGYFT